MNYIFLFFQTQGVNKFSREGDFLLCSIQTQLVHTDFYFVVVTICLDRIYYTKDLWQLTKTHIIQNKIE